MNLYKLTRLLMIALFIVISTGNLNAHHKIIKGTVQLENGEISPVIGANVRLLGTVLGSVTDTQGNFVIRNVPDGKFTLMISAVGMQTIKREIELMHIEGDEHEYTFKMIENPIQTSPVVVTATRSEKIYDDVPIKVSTISKSDFKATSSRNLREALQFQPGVRTEVNCQNCGFSQVRINGLDGKYSQILIDSRPIFSALNGVYGLDQIPSNMVERIEVIRGGGSSLYGGNAIAGVINVITKEPNVNSFEMSVDNMLIKGKYPDNIINLNGTILNDNQDLGVSLYGMINDRHEYDANKDGFTEIGQLNVKTFGSGMFWKLSPKSKVKAEIQAIEHFTRGGNKLNLPAHQSDITEYVEHSTMMGQISYEQFIGSESKINAYASAQQTDRNSYYGAEQDLNAYGVTENLTLASGANYSFLVSELLGYHYVTTGYEFNSDILNDNAPAYNRFIAQTASSHGFYFQDDWSLTDKINLLWGLRTDKHSLVDDIVLNPRTSLLYKIFDDLSFRSTYSTGYRAPQAFDEDLHITQVGGEGVLILLGEGLKPEYSNSISGSVDYSFDLFHLPFAVSFEFFNTNLNDAFILEDAGEDDKGNMVLLRKNGESATVQGVTFEIQSTLRDEYSFKIGATYQKSEYSFPVEWSAGDLENGFEPKFSAQIFKTPDLYGYFIASLEILHDLRVDFSGYYTGSMYVPHYSGYIESDELLRTEEFIDANVKFTATINENPKIALSVGAMNIFDQYQNDFDKGINRDAGFIYGPSRPFTTTVGLSVSY